MEFLFVRFAHSWDMELNTQKQIPHLRAPMYHSISKEREKGVQKLKMYAQTLWESFHGSNKKQTFKPTSPGEPEAPGVPSKPWEKKASVSPIISFGLIDWWNIVISVTCQSHRFSIFAISTGRSHGTAAPLQENKKQLHQLSKEWKVTF